MKKYDETAVESVSTGKEGTGIAVLQNKAADLPVSAMIRAGGDDPEISADDIVTGVYCEFMTELADLGITDFDSDFLPFDPNDGSIDTFDTGLVTVADLMRLIDHAGKIEAAHGILYWEHCCSRDVLETLANQLCIMAESAAGGEWDCSAFPDEQLSCCKLLFMPVSSFTERYRENLSIKFDKSSEVELRMYDIEKMLTWTYGHDPDTQTVLKGMPVVTLLGKLTRYAWLTNCGQHCSKNPQYIYEFLYGLIFNLFGVFRDI